MNYLLDANGFIALLAPDHVHFRRVHAFFQRRPFATCPLIQLNALRFLTRPRVVEGEKHPPLCKPDEALNLVRHLSHARARTFLPEDINCAASGLPFGHVTGHAQWNDAYLVALAGRNQLKLATCDGGLHSAFPDTVKLIPEV
jgi:predicted nucleic acid-binding protein